MPNCKAAGRPGNHLDRARGRPPVPQFAGEHRGLPRDGRINRHPPRHPAEPQRRHPRRRTRGHHHSGRDRVESRRRSHRHPQRHATDPRDPCRPCCKRRRICRCLSTTSPRKSSDLFARLLDQEIVADDETSFAHFPTGGWTAIGPAIAASANIGDFIKPALVMAWSATSSPTRSAAPRLARHGHYRHRGVRS